MRHGRSGEKQKTLAALLLLILLAGATQLLVTQLSCGAEASPGFPEERFVGTAGGLRITAIEFRAEATVAGPEVRLKHLARWSDADAAALAEVGELIVARAAATGPAVTVVDLDDVRQTLQDAGVNLGSVNFTGSTTCKVSRTASPAVPAPLRASIIAEAPTSTPFAHPARTQARTLRELLTADLAQQLGLDVDSLQIRFEARDEKVLAYTDADHPFAVEPRKTRGLGNVAWDITLGHGNDRQKVSINAYARAWQTQVLAARPIAFKQELGPGDVAERRVLIDRTTDDAPLSITQALGQSAARDIAVGSVITGKMLEPPQSARVGQFINVTVEQGAVRVIWVAEARESGARGQTVRVRKPGTREEFMVLLTGPEQAKLLGPAGGTTTKVASRN